MANGSANERTTCENKSSAELALAPPRMITTIAGTMASARVAMRR
eukprot:CAMPEP_0175007456 /NCGR_PEP_ID=MMETSP0005-20121125/6421_1 /TAXON_ID=420556 /ORGANISM="Ochromonas sp., Strain CCMP1393" /LENGTH=44 /DNA_ID= /DNA_START= /DNA_END= /DNA_ORIENTATION=